MNEIWLVGRRVAQSPSAAMHNAALTALGSDKVYSLKSIELEELPSLLTLAADRCCGINVTAPFKERVHQAYADLASHEAGQIGAVNTVIFADGVPKQTYNTDVHGLEGAWRRASVDVTERHTVIYGTGGAARAAAYALKLQGAGSVYITGRTPAHVAAIRNWGVGIGVPITDTPAADNYLLVLATSELEKPERCIAEFLRQPGVVHDLRYLQTQRSRNSALAQGHLFVDGTSMLLEQGFAAAELFVGSSLPHTLKTTMAKALALALRGKSSQNS